MADIADVRRKYVLALKASAPVVAIVGDRSFGPENISSIEWPFNHVGLPSIVPEPDGCGGKSYRVIGTVHAFAKGPDESGVAALASAVEDTLDGLSGDLTISDGAHLQDTLWTGTLILRDTAQENGWHAVVNFEAKVSG